MKKCKETISKLKDSLENLNFQISCIFPQELQDKSNINDVLLKVKEILNLLEQAHKGKCIDEDTIEIARRLFANIEEYSTLNEFVFLKQFCDYLIIKFTQILLTFKIK